MNLEINVDAKEVQEHLVGLIINSTIGESIKKGITKQIESLTSNSYNNPIQECIRDIIIDVVREELLKQKEIIRSKVTDWLTDENIKQTLNKFGEGLKRNF